MLRPILILVAFVFLGRTPSWSQSTSPDTLQTSQEKEEESDPNYVVAEAKQPIVQKLHYQYSIDGIASTGNIERLLLQSTLSLDWKPSKSLKFSSTPSFIFGRQSGLLTEREFFTDIRLSAWHEKKVYGLAFMSWDKSYLRRIQQRWTQAIGAAVKIVQQKRAYFSISNLILHESADFVERTDIDVWRNSTRFFGEFKPDKAGKFSILSVLFIQPAISTRNNFRWSSTLTLNYKISDDLSLRTKFENTYESFISVGRKSNDFRWTIGLSLSN